MSLDLYEREVSERLDRLPKAMVPEVGAFDNFLRGTGMSAMQTFAKAGRAASLALGAPVVAVDRFSNGTEISDRFFRWHDETFGEAVDHWTPRTNEVGVAGQVVGQLLATIPMVIASPAGTVAATGLGTAEDLARKDVSPTKAVATGVVQAAGLGAGIWMPILGNTLTQRVVLGGAGFNLVQGVGTRAASGMILEGTPAAEDFKAFDWQAVTLDTLLGIAFGGLAHLSPAQRAQGAKVWERLDAWSKSLQPSQVDALLVQRQAQHLNVDSLPGAPVAPESVDAHVQRSRLAIEQLARDEPVNVSNLPEGRFEADGPRLQEMGGRAEELVRSAETVRNAEGLPSVPETEGPPVRVSAEPPPPRGEDARPGGPEAKEVDPIETEARRYVEARGDIEVTLGRDADGKPVRATMKALMAESDAQVKLATEDAKLFQIAAACMLGGA
jgi:hypothetical protein